jgi:hypothetical protein
MREAQGPRQGTAWPNGVDVAPDAIHERLRRAAEGQRMV